MSILRWHSLLGHAIALTNMAIGEVGPREKKKTSNPLLPYFLYIMNSSWQTLFFLLYTYNYMYFIATARLYHNPSCIPAGDIKFID